jgi:hypothetical protein
MLRSLAKGLAFLRTVDATQSDTLRVLVVQDFEGVAVEDGDDGAGKSAAWTWQKRRRAAIQTETRRCLGVSDTMKDAVTDPWRPEI